MAVDPTDESRDATGEAEKPRVEDEDESDLVQIKRKPKSLIARKSLPSVENALDDFIVSANQKPLDVSEFTAENREQQLRDEIAALKKKLESAESRANEASAVEAPPAAKRSRGAIIGAFLLGAGAMFAINLATKSSDTRPNEAASVPAAAEPTASQPATPQPVAEQPVATPPATPPTPPTPTTTPTEPAAAGSAATPAQPVVAATPKQPKQPHEPKTRKEPAQTEPPAPTGDSAPKQPPPAQDGSGSDLYNPF